MVRQLEDSASGQAAHHFAYQAVVLGVNVKIVADLLWFLEIVVLGYRNTLTVRGEQ
jgi:hypothetical protein